MRISDWSSDVCSSDLLLLFAITERSLFIRFALLALASAFHITSIPFFIIYVLGQRWRYVWLAVLGLAAVLRFYFANLLAMIGVMPAAMAEKITYYLNNSAGYTEEIGSSHVRTPVTNAQLLCRL